MGSKIQSSKKPSGNNPAIQASFPPGFVATETLSLRQSFLPPPDEIEAFERACPGAGQQIIAMALNLAQADIDLGKTEQAHDHAVMDRIIGIDERSEKRVHRIIGTIAGACLAIAGAALFLGQPWLSAGFGLPDVAGLAYVLFNRGKKPHHRFVAPSSPPES